jgi:hypothetical protein
MWSEEASWRRVSSTMAAISAPAIESRSAPGRTSRRGPVTGVKGTLD